MISYDEHKFNCVGKIIAKPNLSIETYYGISHDPKMLNDNIDLKNIIKEKLIEDYADFTYINSEGLCENLSLKSALNIFEEYGFEVAKNYMFDPNNPGQILTITKNGESISFKIEEPKLNLNLY